MEHQSSPWHSSVSQCFHYSTLPHPSPRVFPQPSEIKCYCCHFTQEETVMARLHNSEHRSSQTQDPATPQTNAARMNLSWPVSLWGLTALFSLWPLAPDSLCPKLEATFSLPAKRSKLSSRQTCLPAASSSWRRSTSQAHMMCNDEIYENLSETPLGPRKIWRKAVL